MKTKRLPKQEICFHCLADCAGEWGMHRDGKNKGPELSLCAICAGNEGPTCQEIWATAEMRTHALEGLHANNYGTMDYGDEICALCLRRAGGSDKATLGWHYYRLQGNEDGPVPVCTTCAADRTGKEIAEGVTRIATALEL